ncbi:EAL domain-containing protein [Halomonas sp. TRM85114]|uniref:sensor domain-containing protein n=1 Tax=Halomonas jincaotanensis TaxID=2810616 RepID=UPI001BD4BF7E|nr:EAL domain-containing protein [Halomonas jincaotanensis]MBS9405712.1 EAL domain-containing protein [Halomonas jincaotanensis]
MSNGRQARLEAIQDDTGLNRVQDALRTSEAEFRTLVETMPQIVWVTRPDGWHIDFNQCWLDYTGLTLEESLGFGWNPPFHPEDRSYAAELWLQATNSGEPYEVEYRLRRWDGVYRWMLGRAVPMRDAMGNIVKWFGTCTDIDDLKRTQERLDEAQRVGKIGDWDYSPITGETTWSSAVYRMLGRDSRLGPPQTLHESAMLFDAESAVLFKKMMSLGAASGQTQKIDLRTNGGDGREAYVQIIAMPRKDDSGEVVGFFGTIQDISERKHAELALHARAQQQLLVAALGRLALSAASLDELYTEAASIIAQGLNVELSNVLLLDGPQQPLVLKAGIGWGPGWIGRQVAYPVDQTQPYRVLASREPFIIHDFSEDSRFAPSALLTSHGVISGADVLIGGSEKPVGVLGAYADTPRKFSTDDVGFLQGVANILGAAAERQRANEQLNYMALHDPLTDLPNRLLLTDRLNVALSDAKRHGQQVALLFLDLDRFKQVNDVFGHALGDQLLHEVAKRLSRCVRAEDTVSRQGGDEFIVALTGIKVEQDVALIADKILTAISSPFLLEDIEINLGISIGVACFPRHGEDAGTLLRNADAAMYVAKGLGRNCYQFYAPEMNVQALDRLTLESDLHRAIERNELFLMYQPQFSLSTGDVLGLEALVRWRHPSLGLISPGHFIPIAEDSSLIVPVGNWVLESACHQHAWWVSQGLTKGSLAVNISAHQFRQADFCNRISDALLRTGLSPDLLELEVTEGVVMQGIDQVLHKLNTLRELGVTLAIDDFGTGYSSLNYLKQFPLHRLKIDQSFTRGLRGDQESGAIAEAIIHMGHSMGLDVLAEGIETKEQEHHLRTLGCVAGQGFLYAKPLSAEECEEYLRGNVRE